MLEEDPIWIISATSAPGTGRYKAPELMDRTQKTVSKEGDIYAYAMTCFVLYSGLLPFRKLKNEAIVYVVLSENLRPERETISYTINDDLWSLWERCWVREFNERPKAMDILNRMFYIEPSQQISTRNATSSEDGTVLGIQADYIPSSLKDLTSFLHWDKTYFIGHGTYGKVYVGSWAKKPPDPTCPPDVAIKLLRSTDTINSKSMVMDELLKREMAVLGSLRHKNIVPLLGFALISGSLPSLVSSSMSQGTLSSYLSHEPRAERDPLAFDIIQGLGYLHDFEPTIIHGNMKPNNVLIDKDGTARLCDFGLHRILEKESTHENHLADSAVVTAKFSPPEVLDGSQKSASKEGDIYSYAMTCFFLYSGLSPFKHCNSVRSLKIAVLKRNLRPERESYSFTIDDDSWKLWTECWDRNPSGRPSAAEVLERIAKRMTRIKLEQLKPSEPVGITNEGHRMVVHGAQSNLRGSRSRVTAQHYL